MVVDFCASVVAWYCPGVGGLSWTDRKFDWSVVVVRVWRWAATIGWLGSGSLIALIGVVRVPYWCGAVGGVDGVGFAVGGGWADRLGAASVSDPSSEPVGSAVCSCVWYVPAESGKSPD